MILCTMSLFAALSINNTEHNDTQNNSIERQVLLYWESRFFIVMLSIIMPSAVILSVLKVRYVQVHSM